MKKIIIAIIAVIALSSCVSKTEESQKVASERIGENTYKVTIEGHDYLKFHSAYGLQVLHSASCPCGWVKNKNEE